MFNIPAFLRADFQLYITQLANSGSGVDDLHLKSTLYRIVA